MKIRTTRTPILRSPYFQVYLLLCLSLIVGVPLIITFGEFGLAGCLFLYLTALAVVTKILSNEHKRSRRGLSKYNNGNVFFSIDIIAGTALLLGIVFKVSVRDYGAIYGQIGFGLICLAFVVWAINLVYAVKEYYHSRGKFVLISVNFAWFSMLGALSMLLQPEAVWRL